VFIKILIILNYFAKKGYKLKLSRFEQGPKKYIKDHSAIHLKKARKNKFVANAKFLRTRSTGLIN